MANCERAQIWGRHYNTYVILCLITGSKVLTRLWVQYVHHVHNAILSKCWNDGVVEYSIKHLESCSLEILGAGLRTCMLSMLRYWFLLFTRDPKGHANCASWRSFPPWNCASWLVVLVSSVGGFGLLSVGGFGLLSVGGFGLLSVGGFGLLSVAV